VNVQFYYSVSDCRCFQYVCPFLLLVICRFLGRHLHDLRRCIFSLDRRNGTWWRCFDRRLLAWVLGWRVLLCDFSWRCCVELCPLLNSACRMTVVGLFDKLLVLQSTRGSRKFVFGNFGRQIILDEGRRKIEVWKTRSRFAGRRMLRCMPHGLPLALHKLGVAPQTPIERFLEAMANHYRWTSGQYGIGKQFSALWVCDDGGQFACSQNCKNSVLWKF